MNAAEAQLALESGEAKALIDNEREFWWACEGKDSVVDGFWCEGLKWFDHIPERYQPYKALVIAGAK